MFLLMCLAVACAQVRGQEDQAPPSPCPDVFHYSYDSGQWSGFLKVKVPDEAKRMVVVASLFVIDVLLPPEHPGELQLIQDERTVKEQIWSHQINKVDYLLELPVQTPLPVIDKIKINSKVICEGPQVKARNRTKVTYTHRLNGLRPPKTDKLGDQPDMQQGRMLDEAEKPVNKYPGHGKKEGGTGKDTLYNNLELMENEVVKEMIQENDVFPKIQGRSKVEEDDDEDKFSDYELEPVDAESGDANLSDDEEDFADNLDPKSDAEVVDSPKVQTTKSVKKPDLNFNTELDSDEEDEDEDESNEEEDPSDLDLNPNEDAEMLDNTLSETENFNPRKPDPNFKIKSNNEDIEEFTSNEMDPDYGDEDFDNEINPADGTKPRDRPSPRFRRPEFNSRPRGVIYPW